MNNKPILLFCILLSVFCLNISAINAQELNESVEVASFPDYEGNLTGMAVSVHLKDQKFGDPDVPRGISFVTHNRSTNIISYWINTEFPVNGKHFNDAAETYNADNWRHGDQIVVMHDEGDWWLAVNLTKNSSTIKVKREREDREALTYERY